MAVIALRLGPLPSGFRRHAAPLIVNISTNTTRRTPRFQHLRVIRLVHAASLALHVHVVNALPKCRVADRTGSGPIRTFHHEQDFTAGGSAGDGLFQYPYGKAGSGLLFAG